MYMAISNIGMLSRLAIVEVSAPKLLAWVSIVLVLVGCGGAPQRIMRAVPAPTYHDGAPPAAAIDLSLILEPIPRVEPNARYGNHSPYNVLGRRYQVLKTRAGYLERGTASWYGTKFHGKPTSTLERFDMYAFTAAHKTLPLPSYARVTNLNNNKSIVVRINDRGPFVGDRLIDLSYISALKLGIHVSGTAPVEVRVIDPSVVEPELLSAPGADTTIATGITLSEPSFVTQALAAAPSVPARSVGAGLNSDSAETPGQRYLQCGAFTTAVNASALAIRLQNAGFSDARVRRGQDRLFRVLIGPLATSSAADDFSLRLLAAGFSVPRVFIQ